MMEPIKKAFFQMNATNEASNEQFDEMNKGMNKLH